MIKYFLIAVLFLVIGFYVGAYITSLDATISGCDEILQLRPNID